jgi:hypothetical protein
LIFIDFNQGENYEIDVEHEAGNDFNIRGRIIEPGDDVVFVRKDLADSLGVDGDAGTGAGDLGTSYGDGPANQQSCAQATSGSLPTGAVGAPEEGDANDFGGVVRRECNIPATVAGCDPSTCQVAVEKPANYHPDCRFKTEAKLPGIQDTIHPDRHFYLNPPPSAVAPSAPPWHDYLDDNATDNGGGSNSLVAGTGQTDVTYDESGTFYICYKQDRDPTLPGYNFFQLIPYVVIHVRNATMNSSLLLLFTPIPEADFLFTHLFTD